MSERGGRRMVIGEGGFGDGGKVASSAGGEEDVDMDVESDGGVRVRIVCEPRESVATRGQYAGPSVCAWMPWPGRYLSQLAGVQG